MEPAEPSTKRLRASGSTAGAATSTTSGRNVLYITCDQWRASALGCAGHPLVKTPALDRLAADGLRFANHFTQAVQCGPSRACAHTGQYQMNNRGVTNGAPVDRRHTTWALELRKLGYDPVLLGYGDVGPDWRHYHPRDPVLQGSDGGPVAGLTPLLPWNMMGDHLMAWCSWLESLGYDVPPAVFDDFYDLNIPGYVKETTEDAPGYRPAFYRAEHSDTAFHVDKAIEYIRTMRHRQTRGGTVIGRPQIIGAPGWAMHLSILRPHTPWLCPEPYNRMYPPETLDSFLRAPTWQQQAATHPWLAQRLDSAWSDNSRWPNRDNLAEQLRDKAQYYGLVSETDHHLGRLFDALRETGELDNTLVIFSSDVRAHESL
jgi:arylsulfatase A-like enzyme